VRIEKYNWFCGQIRSDWALFDISATTRRRAKELEREEGFERTERVRVRSKNIDLLFENKLSLPYLDHLQLILHQIYLAENDQEQKKLPKKVKSPLTPSSSISSITTRYPHPYRQIHSRLPLLYCHQLLRHLYQLLNSEISLFRCWIYHPYHPEHQRQRDRLTGHNGLYSTIYTGYSANGCQL
jgi:hypothetical protein